MKRLTDGCHVGLENEMTVERSIVASLGDIKKVVFECVRVNRSGHKCGARVSVPPDVAADIPHACLQCHGEWSISDIANFQSSNSPFLDFLTSVAKIRTLDSRTAGFRILLQFDEPQTAS